MIFCLLYLSMRIRLLIILLLTSLGAVAQRPDSVKVNTPAAHSLTMSSLYMSGGNASNAFPGFLDITTGKWIGLATAYQLWLTNNNIALGKLNSDTLYAHGYVPQWQLRNQLAGKAATTALALKVNYTDTASMLANVVHKTGDTMTGPLVIKIGNGSGTYFPQKWQYTTNDTAYNLKLRQVVKSGNVNWIFSQYQPSDITNNLNLGRNNTQINSKTNDSLFVRGHVYLTDSLVVGDSVSHPLYRLWVNRGKGYIGGFYPIEFNTDDSHIKGVGGSNVGFGSNGHISHQIGNGILFNSADYIYLADTTGYTAIGRQNLTPRATLHLLDNRSSGAKITTEYIQAGANQSSNYLFSIRSNDSTTNYLRVTPSAITSSLSVSANSFSGSGTGLTGTAASLNIGGNSATVTTNANLTGVITSVGNTTSITSQTGTGTKFVMDSAPSIANLTGTASFNSPTIYYNGNGGSYFARLVDLGSRQLRWDGYNGTDFNTKMFFYFTNGVQFDSGLTTMTAGLNVSAGDLSASLPTYSTGTNLPVVYNSTNNRFETGASGLVNSVTSSDNSLTFSPTSGNVIGSVNTAHGFTWTGLHQFNFGEVVGTPSATGFALFYSGIGSNYTTVNSSTKSGPQIFAMPDASGIAVVEPDTIDFVSQTAALTTNRSIVKTGAYQVNVFLNIRSITTDVVKTAVTWTDETNTSQTASFYSQGSTSPNLGTTGPSNYAPLTIYCKGGTNLAYTVSLVTGGGSINYDFYGRVIHL